MVLSPRGCLRGGNIVSNELGIKGSSELSVGDRVLVGGCG